jgi:phosphatidylserine decarboxylase
LTVYLAPWNYHRIHAPADAGVTRARHVPGALWPVNAWSVRSIAGLFARNDRVLVEMESQGSQGGRMTIALVGATNVGRTTLAFSDLTGNAKGEASPRDFVPAAPVPLVKGGDLACFEMGSTIVLVLDAFWTARLRPGLLDDSTPVPVRLGQGFST